MTNYAEFKKGIQAAAKGVRKNFSKVKILMVDHEESSSKMLYNLLRNLGFSKIDKSKSTSHSLNLIKKEHYDIFFINYKLNSPDTGMALIDHLYAYGYQEKALTFLVLSDKDKILAEFPPEYNADGIFKKPYNASKLLAMVHDACTMKLLQQKTHELVNEKKIREAIILNLQGAKGKNKIFGTLAAARIYEKLGSYEDAISLYRAHLQLFPNCAIVLDSIGLLMKKDDRFSDAELHFIAAMKKNPCYIPAQLHLSALYYQNGEKGKAREILKLALRINPMNTAVNKEFAQVSQELGDFKSAEIALKRVLNDTKYAEDSGLLTRLGNILMKNKKLNESLDSYNKSVDCAKVEENSDKRARILKDTLTAKGKCYLKFDDPAKKKLAAGCFNAAERAMRKIDLSPEAHDEFKLSVGKSYLEHDMDEEAGNAFSEYIDTDPKSKVRQGKLKGIYSLFGKLKAALDLIERAIQRAMENINKLDQENRRLRREGRFAEAVANYQELLKRYPSDDGLQFNCARTCLEWSQNLGESTEEGRAKKAVAFTHFRAALKLDHERIAMGLKAIGVEEKEVLAPTNHGAPPHPNSKTPRQHMEHRLPDRKSGLRRVQAASVR